jgi:hypothetical protein
MEMKNCPFCGKKVEARLPFLSSFFDPDANKMRWDFSHHCNFGGDLTVTIDCWGDTEEECIEKWNNRAEVSE